MEDRVLTVSLAVILLIILNMTAFVLFYYDKHAAQDQLWRISEGTLLLVALIGGSVGAILGQQLMRHKTRKEPFRTMLFSIPVLQILAGVFLAR